MAVRWDWKNWPWSEGGYTAGTIELLQASAMSQHKKDLLGCVEAASGFWARGMCSAVVGGQESAVDAVTPGWLYRTGRELLLNGESVSYIEVVGGSITLSPVSGYAIRGHSRHENQWTYELQLPAPDGTVTVKPGSTDVVHVRLNASSMTPWRGVSPLSGIGTELGLALDSFLIEESRQVVQQIAVTHSMFARDRLSLQKHEADQQYQGRQNLRGKPGAVDSMFPDAQFDFQQSPGVEELKRVKFGPEVSPAWIALRRDVESTVANAAGIPPGLMAVSGAGTANREDIRRLFAVTLQPISILIRDELRRKLEDDTLVVDVGAHAREADLASRARGFQSLVGGGMSVAEAVALSGLTSHGASS